MLRSAGIWAGLAALVTSGQSLADDRFLARFDGRLKGGGTIQRDVDRTPRKVTCTLTGKPSGPDSLTIAGQCRAAVIVTRPVSAQIRYDPASGSYSGTYAASATGPARLTNGRLQGSTLSFDVTYAKPIYGDRSARMTIGNAGDGTLSMTVTDQVDGRSVQTSAITLAR